MARRAGPAEDDEEVELNMTPMLDVVFILLIFFIVTAVFVKEPGVEVTRPEVDIFQEDLRPTILVAVNSEDEVWINKKLVARKDLRTEVQALQAENPKAEAIVQGDDDAKFSIVYEVMEALRDAGVETQYVSTREGRV